MIRMNGETLNVTELKNALIHFLPSYDYENKRWIIECIFTVPKELPQEKLSIFLVQDNNGRTPIGHIISNSSGHTQMYSWYNSPAPIGTSTLEVVSESKDTIHTVEYGCAKNTEVRWRSTYHPENRKWLYLEFMCSQRVAKNRIRIKNGLYEYQMPKDIIGNSVCRLLIRCEESSSVEPVVVDRLKIDLVRDNWIKA